MTTSLVLQDAFSSRRLRVLQRTSASQIDLYERCPRSWFYRYIEGVESPQTPAQLRGSQIHRLIEDSLAAGKLADDNHEHAPIVRDGMRLWPTVPANGERVIERELHMRTFANGPEVIGYVDLADAWKDSLIRVDVWDHKSTSDFRYVKTEEELTSNTQMVTYAKWAFDVIGADVVRVGHLYYRTKMPPRSRSVGPVIMLRERVESEWSRRLATVASMVRDARELPSGDASPPLGSQTGECERYGGCPHRARCGFDTLGPSRNFTGEKMSDGPSLLERLNASLAPTNGVPTSAPPPAAPAPAPTVFAPPAAGPHAHPGAVGVSGYVPGQECNGKGYYASANGQGFINVEPGHMCRACVGPQTVQPGQVLPPDAPTRTSTPEEIQAVVEGKKKRGRKPKADPSEMLRVYSELNEKRGFSINEIERLQKEDGIEDALAGKITPGMMRQFGGPPVASAMMVPAVLHGPTVVLEPKKEAWYQNSGPPLAPDLPHPLPAPPAQVASAPVALPPPTAPVQEMIEKIFAPAPVAQPAAPPLTAPAHVSPPLAPPQPASIPRPPQGLTLYIDCAPVKGSGAVAHLEDWLAPIAAKAAAEHVDRETGKRKPYSDWRFIPYVSKAVLADAIRGALNTLPQTFIVSSASGGADVFIEVVTPWCATIVRPLAGVR